MDQKRYWLREPFCGLSHFAGAILSVAALVVLLILARGRLAYEIGFSIYGASLILLYTVSTLYHSLYAGDKTIEWLQRCDHMAIFLLIAGTYTPVCLIILPKATGRPLLIAVYGIALLGISLILFFKRVPHWIRVALYILMGWLAILAYPTMRAVMPPAMLTWLIVGGLVYTVGTVFYATNRPRLLPGLIEGHDIWHLFVMGGSGCHFIAILYLVLPR